jgi:hypothetical protein
VHSGMLVTVITWIPFPLFSIIGGEFIFEYW